MPEIYYRYEDRSYAAPINEYEEICGKSALGIVLREFEVIRHTKCGVVLAVYDETRFVLNCSRKKFAHKTVEEALTSFIARKKRQINILANQYDRAKAALHKAKLMQSGMKQESILGNGATYNVWI